MPRVWIAIALVALSGKLTSACCPFCVATKPTFSQIRDRSNVLLLGTAGKTGETGLECEVFDVYQGENASELKGTTQTVRVSSEHAPGELLLLCGATVRNQPLAKGSWTAFAVDETRLAYYLKAPPLRERAKDRLTYYLERLEHPDAAINDDAYQEFAHATFDEVAQLADVLPYERFREWVTTESVGAERIGFYGMALGLAKDPAEREANLEALIAKINLDSQNEFRAGFDGALAGILLLEGEQGLERIEEKFLDDPQAREGDLRHVESSLRFIAEFGKDIPKPRVALAVRKLLARPGFASTVIPDLARLEDWDCIDDVVEKFAVSENDSSQARAVVGYLLASPKPEARERLESLRARYPEEVAAAERELKLFGGAR